MPLKAIILIERGEDNKIQKISFSDAFRFIMNQVYLPRDENKMTLKLIQELSSKVSLWRFQCNNFKDDCFNVVYEALEGRGE